VVDGKLYGLPMNSSMMLLYCNRGLFEKAGAQLALPRGANCLPRGKSSKPSACGRWRWAREIHGSPERCTKTSPVREVGAEKCSAVLSGEASMLDDPGFRTAAEKMNELYQERDFGR
jgi:raffinose/stachyose/melibiose transport system substrate-binding protein